MSYFYPASFVKTFVGIWRLKEGHLTLTGSYVRDLWEYPGFWEHDFPICLAETEGAEAKAKGQLAGSENRADPKGRETFLLDHSKETGEVIWKVRDDS